LQIIYKIKVLLIISSIFFSCTNDDDFSDGYSSIYEDGEELLTGSLSVKTISSNAFGKSIPGLTLQESIKFGSGNSLFTSSWVSVGSTSSIDGLGPTFNAKACVSCHTKDGRGKPHTNNQDSNGFLMRISLPGKNSKGGPLGHPTYGKQIQDQANIGVTYEAKINSSIQIINGNYPDGTSYQLTKPIYSIVNQQFENIGNVLTSPRVGTQTIGLGLIDALSEESILENADEFDKNKDGISGRANYVWNELTNSNTIGKFGWKANQPSLRQQVADAFIGDMGLTSSIFNEANCPDPQEDCINFPNGESPEVTNLQLDKVVFYQSALAVPKRRNFKDLNVLKGKTLFKNIECIKCHSINYTTGQSKENSHLENININPFSDFLLHDMGDDLADNRPDFLANGKEWRTQPLWGIGLISTVNNHTNLLHDGRARNIEEAILWHGGEAENSKQQFMRLSSEERSNVLQYINTL
jgi:CxxC motif-containing protein (DUF1111 family)